VRGLCGRLLPRAVAGCERRGPLATVALVDDGLVDALRVSKNGGHQRVRQGKRGRKESEGGRGLTWEHRI
jgi:hypothetical protein